MICFRLKGRKGSFFVWVFLFLFFVFVFPIVVLFPSDTHPFPFSSLLLISIWKSLLWKPASLHQPHYRYIARGMRLPSTSSIFERSFNRQLRLPFSHLASISHRILFRRPTPTTFDLHCPIVWRRWLRNGLQLHSTLLPSSGCHHSIPHRLLP